MKTLLGRRAFRDLFVGQAVSALGDWMVTVALMALVLKLTRSSTAVGGVLVLRLVPAAIAGPLAARAAARWDRRRTMVSMDVVRALMIESPLRSRSKVAGSSRATLSMSGRWPVLPSIRSRVRSITDKFRSPRKSILSSPSSSTPCISYWVTIGASSGALPCSGLR